MNGAKQHEYTNDLNWMTGNKQLEYYKHDSWSGWSTINLIHSTIGRTSLGINMIEVEVVFTLYSISMIHNRMNTIICIIISKGKEF